MTNQEAREILVGLEAAYRDLDPLEFTDDGIQLLNERIEAVRAAISALEKQDVPDKNVGDTISRQAAIDCFWTKERYFRDALDVIKDIRQLPPAQPDRKHGKWIYRIDDIFPAESTMECDQCHAEQPLTCDDEFCPHCGARMDGDK